MCTLATIKLQVRIFCWLKLTLSIYIFATGIYFASSTVIKQAFGLAYVGYGVGLVFLGLLSGVMVFPQKFGIDRHNRFLLGLSFVCDTIVFAEMINFTGIVNSYIAPEFPKALQLDCLSIAPQTYSASQCSEYFNSDRLAGMRLVWESYFSDKSNKLSYQMLQNLERGCCGFFTPFNCIPNKNSFPADRYVGNIKSQLLQQRVICSSFANYYPAQDNCINYYDYSANPPIIGGCKYDMGVGYCLTVDIDGSMIGCASAVEDYSVTLITPHVPLLMICAAVHALFMLYTCCMWWKRKDSDVFPEFTTVIEEKVKYENVKDQFEVVPRRGSLLKDGFLPVATYKQLVEEKTAAEEESEEHADDRGGPHGVIPIYEKAEDAFNCNNVMYRLSHPSGTTHAQYHKYWECNSCNHRYNPVDIASCLICDKERTRHRYSAVVNGSIYLCRLLKNNTTLTVLNVFNDNHFVTDLMKSEGTIDESIVEAIGRHLDEVCSVTALSTSDKKKSTLTITSSSPTKLSSLLGSSLSLLLNPGLSLFDQVLSNAESVVYSSKIGQYVSKDTVTVDSDTSVTTIGSSPMKAAFSYVSAMNKERHVMSDVVSEVVRRRKEAYLYDSSADLDVNRNEWESFQICQLCERSYPKSQLYGLISMKAVINWKIEHNVQFAPNDHRLDITNIHSGAKLCIFCTQFFDTKYCDLFDPQQMKLSVGISNIPGPLNCSNTVYKKMLRTSVKKWQLLGQARPLSRMRHKLELEQLKLKATQSEINKTARFQYNPKQPDHLVDQEVVGNYLRRKYVESKDSGLSALPKKKNKKKIKKLAPIAIPTPLDSIARHVPDHSVKVDQLSTKARREPHELLNTKSDAIKSIHSAPAVKRADALVITSSHSDKHTALVSSNNSASVPTTNSSSSDANVSKHVPRTRKRLTLQIKGPSGDATTGDRDDRRVIEIELCSDSIKATLPKLKLHSLLDNIKLHRGIHDIPVQRPTEEVDSITRQETLLQCSRNDIDSARGQSKIVERDCYHEDDLIEDCYYEDDFIEDEVTPTDETEGDGNKMGNEDNNSGIIDGDGRKDSRKNSALSSDEHLQVIVDDSPTPTDDGTEQRKTKHVTVPLLFIPEEINYESDLPDEEGEEGQEGQGEGEKQQATIPQTEDEEGEGEGGYVDDFTEDGGDLFDEGDDYYYDDDEFLSDGGDDEQEKSWGLVESMDEYNWVTGGAFVPPTGGINTATIIIDGSKSPIKSPLLVYEASLPFKTADRIELLSRASSSGFSFRPNSTDSPSRESRHRKYMGSGRISTTGDQLSPFGNHNILVNAWEISSPTRYVDNSSMVDKLPSEIQEGQSVDGDQKYQSVKGVTARRTTNTNRKVFEKTKKLKSKYSTGLKPTWKS